MFKQVFHIFRMSSSSSAVKRKSTGGDKPASAKKSKTESKGMRDKIPPHLILKFDLKLSLGKDTHAIYRDLLVVKKKKNQCKIFCYFSYFAPKHRLWVLVRTALPSRF